ncbi:hypothetical protein [uncultured Methanoregula sp.]|uniref:hypothetical protein n=1 Tax=uncultured Methanoregula sp. TaxID=1005933 RepID=UPI002AAC21D8|nr:hypothetical protein [uncultured Methanoregula sp.]
MQKSIALFFISLVCITFILIAGCTTPENSPSAGTTPAAVAAVTPRINATPDSANTSTGSAASQPAPGTPGLVTTAPPVNQKTLLNESFSLITGDRNSAKIYSFKELGRDLLEPGDTFIISVDSAKPLNILVTDANGKGNFNGVTPKWEKQPTSKTTNTKMYGWSYPGIWTALKSDEVFHRNLVLKIEREGSYYIIFDPQNIVEQVSELGIWQRTYNNFNVHAGVDQVVHPLSADILPKSPYIIDDTFAVYDAYRDGFKVYPLEDYGLEYQNPGDTFRLSINSEKPVNVLVLNSEEKVQFDGITPVYEMQPEKGDREAHYGYTYTGISPLVKEDKVTRKDITFTIKKTGKYYIIIDQRFADPLSKTISFFKGAITLSKI